MKISVGKWIGFNVDWQKGKHKGLRFGQAFLNTLLPSVQDPDLFHETELVEACEIIRNKYVDWNSKESFREGEVSQETKDTIKRNLHK